LSTFFYLKQPPFVGFYFIWVIAGGGVICIIILLLLLLLFDGMNLMERESWEQGTYGKSLSYGIWENWHGRKKRG